MQKDWRHESKPDLHTMRHDFDLVWFTLKNCCIFAFVFNLH